MGIEQAINNYIQEIRDVTDDEIEVIPVRDPETLLKVYYVTLLPKSPQKDQFLSATMILY